MKSHVSLFLCLLLGLVAAPVSALAATIGQLRAMPELKANYKDMPALADGDVLMVFAHPDDELQTIAQVSKIHELEPGRTVRWIMVSDAGAGMIFPFTCVGKTKTECRMEEAKRVAFCEGLPEPEQMGLPDSHLREVPDLQERIWQKITARGTAKIAAIFSSDDAGLYGHPDHLAVHDAMAPIAAELHVPFVSGALPAVMAKSLPLREPAVSEKRQRPEINVKLDLDAAARQRAVCAARAYKSQELLVLDFMQFLLPRNFYGAVPRDFMNYQSNE